MDEHLIWSIHLGTLVAKLASNVGIPWSLDMSYLIIKFSLDISYLAFIFKYTFNMILYIL